MNQFKKGNHVIICSNDSTRKSVKSGVPCLGIIESVLIENSKDSEGMYAVSTPTGEMVFLSNNDFFKDNRKL